MPPSLTLEKLRHPRGSVPFNPQLAEPLYLTKYIERMGTGTGDMIRRCREVGLPVPKFSVSDGFVTTIWRKGGQVVASQPESLEQRVLGLLTKEPLSKSAISSALGQKEISGHLNQVIRVLLNDQTLEHTLPDKPNSRLQQYRLTDKGRLLLGVLRKGNLP